MKLTILLTLLIATTVGTISASDPLQNGPTPVAGVEPDAEFIEFLAPYRAEVAKLEVPIIESVSEMVNVRRENPLGSWVTDTLRASASELLGKKVDVAFVNSGGIRAPMPQGPVSYRTITTILPFDNSLVFYELKGSELKPIFAEMAKRRGADPISGAQIVASEEGELISVEIAGEPLDPEKIYVFATISFLAEGGGGWTLLTEYERSDTGVMIRDVIYKEVERMAARGEKIQPPDNPTRYLIGGKTVEELAR